MCYSEKDVYNLYLNCTYAHNRIATSKWKIEHEIIEIYNLVLIYDGQGTFEGGREKIAVKKGDLICFQKGERQIMHTDKNNLLKFYTVNFQCILPRYENGRWNIAEKNLPLKFCTPIDDKVLFDKLFMLFDKICKIHISGVKNGESEAALLKIIELSVYAHNGAGSYQSIKIRNKINDAIKFMSENIDKKITVPFLAKMVNLSPSHFAMSFKKVTGYSPVDYLIYMRISKAKMLLDDKMSITAVSEIVGFSDVYYFSKSFKKIVGVSPSNYKKSYDG